MHHQERLCESFYAYKSRVTGRDLRVQRRHSSPFFVIVVEEAGYVVFLVDARGPVTLEVHNGLADPHPHRQPHHQSNNEVA